VDLKKNLSYGLVVSGGLLTIMGMAFVGMYIVEAIIARAGEPDQSLLFWYLPILFLGLMGMMIGLGVGAWGVWRLRKIRRQMTGGNAQPADER
jgi:hypothetical protein